jgi:tetratricopeptide (TPR) repeat protein
MAKKKNEVKQEELENLTSTERFIDKYKQPLIIGGGAIVVIVLGIVGYQKFVAEPHEKESLDAYWNAFYEFENDSLDLAVNGNDEFNGMAEVAEEYDGTSGGDIAHYTVGLSDMENGDFESAIENFESCDFEDIVLGSMVIGLQGDCYAELADYEEAAEKYEEAANREANEFTSPMYLKKAGIAYEALGNTEDALRVYKEIKENWSESTEGQDIEKYIARIGG